MAYAAPVAAQTPQIAAAPQWRGSYAVSLRQQCLKNGWPITVYVDEKAPAKTDGLTYPKLTLFGPIGDPFVYKVASGWQLVDHASELGFKSIDFSSNIGQGRYIFDLSGAKKPHCDTSNRVCF